MAETEEIINRVAKSPLITIDLEDYYIKGERLVFDMEPWLFQGLILKEKDFRAEVKNHDWSIYKDKLVAITCSVDAIVPTWAYMLLASKLEGIAQMFVFGTEEELERILILQALNKINLDEFTDKKLIIKGCGDLPITAFAYVEIVRLLKPVASSIMYGEACSSVPVFKNKK